MTEQKTITPTIMADELGIQAITLRRWCTAFAAHLSPLANPSPGNARRFTYRDREVLKHVRSLRDQDRSLVEIGEQLADLTFPEVEPNQPILDPHDDQPERQQEPRNSGYSLLLEQRAELITRADLTVLERKIEQIEQRRYSYVTAFGIGFLCCAFLFILLLLLASLYGLHGF